MLRAIEYDDTIAFGTLMDETECGRIRLGRFPVLSLMYLYNSRRLISAYEREFLEISSWKVLGEPSRIVNRFAVKAGKCLRLYFDKVVSPLEMLLVLDKTKRLKKVYPYTRPTDEIKNRLQSIYFIKYSLGISFNGDGIIIDRRPLSAKEKKRFTAIAVGCFFAAAAVVATPISISSYVKKHAGDVTQLNQIDFAATTTYTLKRDIAIPDNYRVTDMSCSIVGNGHKIILGKNASLGELSGRVSGVAFQTSGTPIFTVCAENATLSDITVKVNADVETDDNSAFVAITNYGTIDGITVNVDGHVSAVAQDGADGSTELIFGGVVMHNAYTYGPAMPTVYGTVKNCSVTYTGFTLSGETYANATFGGVVGVNNGVVQDCNVSGSITADTFDLAGACYANYNELIGIVSETDLSQTSGEEWNPIVSGIAIDNTTRLERCVYAGDITVAGQNTALCSGIIARTYGSNIYCYSSGNISVTADDAYIGGIYAISQVVSNNYSVYFGVADHCISEVNITAAVEDTSYVGGIGGYVQEGEFYQIVYDDYGWPLTQLLVYLGGGVTDCIFMGTVNGGYNYAGNIVGVCGANIYEKNSNSYTSGETKSRNFDGNYYTDDSRPAFGAVAVSETQFSQVRGKGATQSTESGIKNTDTYKDIVDKLGL